MIAKLEKQKKIALRNSRFEIPWELFGDLIYIPGYKNATLKLQPECLHNIKSFKDFCHCQIDHADVDPRCNYEVPEDLEPQINDTNNGIITIWGIDFDYSGSGKSVYFPNFKQSWIRFDMECLFSILTIDDACQCQTEDSKPICKEIKTDHVNLYVKNGTVRFQVDLNRLEPDYMEEDHRLSPNNYHLVDPSDDDSGEFIGKYPLLQENDKIMRIQIPRKSSTHIVSF